MATGGYCLPSKPNISFGETSSDQYSNLNLNQNHIFFHSPCVHSESTIFNSRKVLNYDFNDSQAEQIFNSWNKPCKGLSSSFINLSRESDEQYESKNSKSFNNSTLSLHIAAYENSIEAINNSDGVEKKVSKSKSEEPELLKKWGTLKHVFADSSSKFQNPFEFPRQQTDDQSIDSGVMQFKASQKLLNPNQLASAEGDLSFNILARCNRAREGVFRLPHGDVMTPIFMPVGTQGTIKGLCPRQVEETGCRILLCNTYHLGHRPGHEIVDKAGGIHKMMDWKYNILTDSGGFQMVSLDSMMKVDEEGVNFRSPHNGEQMHLTPEHSINIQQALGSDIMMQLDHVVSSVSDDSDFKEPMERSIRWLDRCDKVHNNRKKQILFPIIQGGLNFELRKECIDKMVPYAKYGIAIGGLSGGEEKEGFWKTVDFCCKHLPENLPKYVMGVGWQTDMVLCALSGADMFDCVYPTRTARFGTALVFENASNGELHINRQIYKDDFRPVEEDCTCRTCKKYTRAFIHASIGKEAVACHLLTVHNIHHQLELMKRLRKAINLKNVGEFLKNFIDGQFSGVEKCPAWAKMAIKELGYGPDVFETSKPEKSPATNGA